MDVREGKNSSDSPLSSKSAYSVRGSSFILCTDAKNHEKIH